MSIHNIWGVFNFQREKSSPVCVYFVLLQYMIILKQQKIHDVCRVLKSIHLLHDVCVDAKNKLLQKGKKLHQPGIEPGVGRWQRPMLPLHHWCGNRAGRK